MLSDNKKLIAVIGAKGQQGGAGLAGQSIVCQTGKIIR